MSKTPHKHAALIKAWADGEKIQYFDPTELRWIRTFTPLWNSDYVYRIEFTPIKKKCWVLEYRMPVTGGTSISLTSNHQHMVNMQKDSSFIRIIAEIEYEETQND